MPTAPQRLHLSGDPPPRAVSSGPAIAAKGFRPFFLLAGVLAVAFLPMWLAALFGGFDPGVYLGAIYWHAHEMVFGFAVAVIAGFLLTAAGNWTQRETAVGMPLMGLAALWVAGRFAVLGAWHLPRFVPAIVDLAFLPAVALAIGRPIVASKNRRNYVMVGVLVALFVTNLVVHLDALGIMPGWRRRGNLLGVDVVVLVILVMAGRIFPMFTRNATRVEAIRSVPALEIASIASIGVLCVLDVALPDSRITPLFAGATGVVVAARSVTWGGRHSLKIPLLGILHVGYLWIPVGLILRAVTAYTTTGPAPVATHALTVGAIGGLTLGMMSRVSLGHTGRPLVATPMVTASFVLVSLSALVRVATPLVHMAWYRAAVMVAGVAWTLAFAIFLAVHTPMLFAPRIDGKAG
ncbi:MAG: NnrS family protein [Deltaproteobacteria bacterium]